ncbi:MAG TPA: hypothetical protein VK849_10295 [Longimicrobiales bacterium]|nr:hypothetical protein [Longimicrobiales bacterium]
MIRRMAAGLAAVSTGLLACAGARFVAEPSTPMPAPDLADVQGVIFLVGDAGEARSGSSPLVHRLRVDVETWSGGLPADSSVLVLFLGDNVYPAGVRERTHRDYPRDTAHLNAQIRTVSGPEARRRHARAIFLAGNHDWGNARGDEGLRRLRNMEEHLEAAAAAGAPVALRPAAGEPGPYVVDLPFSRLVLMDTHWWLQSEDAERKERMIEEVGAALDGDEGAPARGGAPSASRPVIVAAHHPWTSGGPHGGALVDPLWLLRRAGALVQDLNSEPYAELRAQLGTVFSARGAPLVFAAGHDHSLQVLRGTEPADPTWTLISGAGSKLTEVEDADGLEWAGDRPGYMRLVFLRSGDVHLFVEGVPARYLQCEGSEQERARCMSEGIAAAGPVHSMELRGVP